MAPRVDLKQGELAKHVARALKSLRDGYVIVAPVEHGYVYLADAFSHYAVRAMHVLHSSEDGVAAQVLVHSAATAQGITRDVSQDTETLMKEFWPGLLSLTLKPNRGLNWDLGDDQSLDLVNVRAPKSRFIRALLKESGPLAAISASPAGETPLLKIDRAAVKDWDVAVVFDNGALKSGPRTTIVEQLDAGLRVSREAAITVAQMTAVAPGIFVE
ncbi:MAG: Sua5/YciO/YrdC/YwlC family protein [Actinobacteria bacterium]|nr:Sua5/YciO/YrdC/YwlC family protein [Actinomycetota bacterium]